MATHQSNCGPGPLITQLRSRTTHHPTAVRDHISPNFGQYNCGPGPHIIQMRSGTAHQPKCGPAKSTAHCGPRSHVSQCGPGPHNPQRGQELDISKSDPGHPIAHSGPGPRITSVVMTPHAFAVRNHTSPNCGPGTTHRPLRQDSRSLIRSEPHLQSGPLIA